MKTTLQFVGHRVSSPQREIHTYECIHKKIRDHNKQLNDTTKRRTKLKTSKIK